MGFHRPTVYDPNRDCIKVNILVVTSIVTMIETNVIITIIQPMRFERSFGCFRYLIAQKIPNGGNNILPR